MYQLIIICILVYVIVTQPSKNREGVFFDDPYLLPYYEKNDIFIDPYNETLTKNDITISYATQLNPIKYKDLANDKYKTKKLFIQNNIPTLNSYKWNKDKSYNDNFAIIKSTLKFPLVIKPNSMSRGSYVFANIPEENVKEIITLILKKTNDILIEEYYEGNTYRILMLNGEILYAYEIQKPAVFGNGKNTISELIDGLRKKSDIPLLPKQIITGNYKLSDILPNGEKLIISNVSNGSVNSTLLFIQSYEIHPDNISLFKKVSEIAHLNLNGIDYMTKNNLAVSYKEGGVILENNFTPSSGTIDYAPNGKERFIKNIIFEKKNAIKESFSGYLYRNLVKLTKLIKKSIRLG